MEREVNRRSNQNKGHKEVKIAIILRAIAALIIAIGIFIGIVNFLDEPFIGIIYFVSSIVSGIFILGFAEIIDLLDKIENNTANR